MTPAAESKGEAVARLREPIGELDGRVAIVTGGAQGIGLEIASTFASAGAYVAIADTLGDKAFAAATRLREEALSAEAYRADVTQRQACRAVVDEVLDSVGRLDVLVNSAGVALYGPSESFPEESWRRSIDVMLTGPFFMSQAAAAPMIAQQGGAIVNLASITGVGGWPMRAAYNAAKAGVIGLTRVLATEWAEHDIRVNAISPGPIETVLMREAFEQGVASREQFERRAPAGRIGSVMDVAAAALFLASERSSYVTGANLRVDGGWLAWANPDGEGFPSRVGDDYAAR